MKFLLSIIFACILAEASGFHVKFIDCKGDKLESASTAFVDITPCTSFPCNLVRGSTYSLSVNFETAAAPASIPKIETHLYAIIAGVRIPFPGFNNTNACDHCNLDCPLVAGRSYTYSLPITVDKSRTIDIECPVEVRLVDVTTKKDLVCIESQVKVVG